MVRVFLLSLTLLTQVLAFDEDYFWTIPINQSASISFNYLHQNLGQQTRIIEQIGFSKPWGKQEVGLAFERENDQPIPNLRLAHRGFGRAEIAIHSQIKDFSYELNQNGSAWVLWQGIYYKQRSMLSEKSWFDSTAEYQAIFGSQWSPLSKLPFHFGFSIQTLEKEFAPNAHTLMSLNSGLTFYLLGNHNGVLLPISPSFMQAAWKQQGLSLENSYEFRYWQGAKEYNLTHSLRSEWQKDHIGMSLRSYILHHFKMESLWWGHEINLNLQWNSWSTEFYLAQNRPLFQTRSQGWNLHFQYKKLFF